MLDAHGNVLVAMDASYVKLKTSQQKCKNTYVNFEIYFIHVTYLVSTIWDMHTNVFEIAWNIMLSKFV